MKKTKPIPQIQYTQTAKHAEYKENRESSIKMKNEKIKIY